MVFSIKRRVLNPGGGVIENRGRYDPVSGGINEGEDAESLCQEKKEISLRGRGQLKF